LVKNSNDSQNWRQRCDIWKNFKGRRIAFRRRLLKGREKGEEDVGVDG